LLARIEVAVVAAGFGARAVFDRGDGVAPYPHMLALADAVLVTGDSANMVGEATASGAPVHVYEPSGRAPKIERLVDALIAEGGVRRWSGRFEVFEGRARDATAEIAAHVARAYRAHRARLGLD
jgi:hypothetical protein